MATTIAEPPHLAADLKTLCLSTIGAQWRLLAEQAARQRQAPADYLAQLVHLEVTGRRERRIQRRIQDARFPMLKTLDAFSFEAQPDLDRDAILQVFDCRFVAEAANVVFVGGVGTGKTHLSIALGMTCCQHDYRVRFVTAAELVTLLVEAQQQGRLARKLAQLARFDLVIVDELGYVPLDKAGADLLFGFISQRYERRSLVVTTNLPFARWSEVFLDPTAAAAVIDRIVHHATVLQDHRRQLQAAGRQAEPGAGTRQEGSPLMPPGRAPVQRQLFCRSPWWRWAGCGSTRGACGTARFPHGGRVGHGCAGSAIAREADGRQDVGGGRRGGGDERAGGAQGDEAEVLSTLLAERYERRSVMVTSNLVFSPWDRNVRAPSRLSPVRYVTVWSSRGVDERGAAGALPGAAEGRRVPDPVPPAGGPEIAATAMERRGADAPGAAGPVPGVAGRVAGIPRRVRDRGVARAGLRSGSVGTGGCRAAQGLRA